ncbi:DUF55-domain-containing protein [Pholiota conissans]|uniref:DUF55-domain-containing protein n=1 Tax=Pholiota conissans TaxID=109636 RepID=A0A9P5Z2H8_9AGAR|nr:DUF55-domain-containing protein [Pholiota conissans]
MSSESKYWLLKAEPDSRVVKGKDVKFSVDDFESVGTSPWEGVRNYEARNLMKEMKEGDKALFYHSNCKTPGIAAFAKVSKEAYPDYTAWDPSHPYFDPKTKQDAPKWFMVDLTFTARAKNFVPLSLLRTIADTQPSSIPEDSEWAYIGAEGVKAIKSMDLVTRGRLSVQRVQEDAWTAIGQLAERGGWKEPESRPKKGSTKRSKASANDDDTQAEDKAALPKKSARKAKAAPQKVEEGEDGSGEGDEGEKQTKEKSGKGGKRKREDVLETSAESAGLRRSTRARK